jgi:hypothetical protein
MVPRELRQFFVVRPPRASNMMVLAASGVVATQDLRAGGNQQHDDSQGDKRSVGYEDSWISLFADGATIYVAFGPSAASVGSITIAGNGVNQATGCYPIPNGTSVDVFIAPSTVGGTASPDRFIGYVTAGGAGQLRIAQTSPPGKMPSP